MHWPTKIVCGKCRSQHYYRFGHLIGVLYLAVLLPASHISSLLSHRFANVENGIYTRSALQNIVDFGGAALVFIVVAFAYGNIMKRWFNLCQKDS